MHGWSCTIDPRLYSLSYVQIDARHRVPIDSCAVFLLTSVGCGSDARLVRLNQSGPCNPAPIQELEPFIPSTVNWSCHSAFSVLNPGHQPCNSGRGLTPVRHGVLSQRIPRLKPCLRSSEPRNQVPMTASWCSLIRQPQELERRLTSCAILTFLTVPQSQRHFTRRSPFG